VNPPPELLGAAPHPSAKPPPRTSIRAAKRRAGNPILPLPRAAIAVGVRNRPTVFELIFMRAPTGRIEALTATFHITDIPRRTVGNGSLHGRRAGLGTRPSGAWARMYEVTKFAVWASDVAPGRKWRISGRPTVKSTSNLSTATPIILSERAAETTSGKGLRSTIFHIFCYAGFRPTVHRPGVSSRPHISIMCQYNGLIHDHCF
jgi:hypothetical protein